MRYVYRYDTCGDANIELFEVVHIGDVNEDIIYYLQNATKTVEDYIEIQELICME